MQREVGGIPDRRATRARPRVAANPWLGYALAMEKKAPVKKSFGEEMEEIHTARMARPSALLDTRVIYCGDYLEQLRNLSDACVDLIYIDPPF